MKKWKILKKFKNLKVALQMTQTVVKAMKKAAVNLKAQKIKI